MISVYSLFVTCASCGRSKEFTDKTRDAAYALADSDGWYIDHDYQDSDRFDICPDCEEFHGNYMLATHLLAEH